MTDSVFSCFSRRDTMSWNDERVALLKKLWLDGHSASQIAAELANGITRNAVIGKVHRLGLAGHERSTPPGGQAHTRSRARSSAGGTRPQPSKARTGTSTRGAAALAADNVLVPFADPRLVEDVIIPVCERVTIMELKESMCRWPLGDPTTPEFRFCGSRTETGASYCTGHARLAYQPAHDRRSKDRRAAFRVVQAISA
jgi:GcrA cell cycle regulator